MTATLLTGASTPLTTPSGQPPTEVHLWGFGEVRARWTSGTERAFNFDRAAADSVMRHYQARGHDLPFDYNHRQLEDPVGADDRALRAAGSFELDLRGDGLWLTRIRWTDDATSYIARREYRYLSPAFRVDKDSRIVELHNVALTALPATLGALPLVANLTGDPEPPEAGRDEDSVDIGELIGLAAGASSAEVALKVTALANFEGTVRAALDDAPDRETAIERLEALQATAAQADLLSERVRQLETAAQESEREQLITTAVREGKLTAAQTGETGWARTAPLDTLKGFLASAPRIVPIGEVAAAETGGDAADGTEQINQGIRRQARRTSRR